MRQERIFLLKECVKCVLFCVRYFCRDRRSAVPTEKTSIPPGEYGICPVCGEIENVGLFGDDCFGSSG